MIITTAQRDRFEIPSGVSYFNVASMAPQLRAVRAAGQEALAVRAAPWTVSSRDWFTPAERLRALFARIIGADAEGVALVPATSYGMAVAAANVPLGRGQSVVVLDAEFPSGIYTWREAARRAGAEVRTVSLEAGAGWTDAVLAAIDERTAVVSVPNCHWTDGSLVDLVQVGVAARRVGAALVVDASQSVGACPIDVAAVQPDFLMAVGYKWLLGPYGLGYLYTAERWRGGMPLEQSWLIREGSDDFSALTRYTDRLRGGARRFDGGEFPQFVLTPMAIAALEQILEWGVDSIAATLRGVTQRIERETSRFCVPGNGVPRIGHMIGLRPAGGVRAELLAALKEAGVYVGARGDAIRVAPHLYNDDADVARLVEALARVG